MSASLMYWSDRLGKTLPRVSCFKWDVTAAKGRRPGSSWRPALGGFDAITQDQIDAHLGSTNEFDADKFDATAMGTDAFAAIVNMRGPDKGQVQRLLGVRSQLMDSAAAEVAPAKQDAGDGLTASTLEIASEKSADGNVAWKCVHAGLDAATSGALWAWMYWISK